MQDCDCHRVHMKAKGQTQVSLVASCISCPQLRKPDFLVCKCLVFVSHLTVGIVIIETHSWLDFTQVLRIWTQATTLRQISYHRAIRHPLFILIGEKISARNSHEITDPLEMEKLKPHLFSIFGSDSLGVEASFPLVAFTQRLATGSVCNTQWSGFCLPHLYKLPWFME